MARLTGISPRLLVADVGRALAFDHAPDGLREFGVRDPDGHEIASGQPLGD